MSAHQVNSEIAQPLESRPTGVLARVPLFSALSEEALRAIESLANTRTYRRNTVIMEKGDETNSLYVLTSGKVKVYVADQEGKELVLSVLEPYQHFGELALLGETERTASVMTLEESKLLLISKQDFSDCLADHPEIAINIIRHLVRQVRGLTERARSLGLADVYTRVANTLLEHAREEDGRLITGRLTQQHLADLVGASREMISRVLKALREGGHIEIEKKRIIITKRLPARW